MRSLQKGDEFSSIMASPISQHKSQKLLKYVEFFCTLDPVIYKIAQIPSLQLSSFYSFLFCPWHLLFQTCSKSIVCSQDLPQYDPSLTWVNGRFHQEEVGQRTGANALCFPGTSIVPQAHSFNKSFRVLPPQICLLQSQITIARALVQKLF